MDERNTGSTDERPVDTMNGVPDATFLPLSVDRWNGWKDVRFSPLPDYRKNPRYHPGMNGRSRPQHHGKLMPSARK